MASNTGGSGSGGGRRSRGLEFGTVDQAEQRGAVKRARVSAGASRSGVSSSGNDRERTMFRSVLTRYLMGISMGYVEQELLTEAVRSEIVHRVVEKIIGHHQEQIPETEKFDGTVYTSESTENQGVSEVPADQENNDVRFHLVNLK